MKDHQISIKQVLEERNVHFREIDILVTINRQHNAIDLYETKNNFTPVISFYAL